LRDGIRTAKLSSHKGLYVFCQADNYRQLFLLDEKGEIVSRHIPRILAAIRCSPEAKGEELPQEACRMIILLGCGNPFSHQAFI
jgi:hypothetical protein